MGGSRWREGLKEHSDLESEDDVSSQRSSLESLRPIILGGEKKQVIFWENDVGKGYE